MLALLEPLTATVLAAVVLGERLEPAGAVGAALLTVAVSGGRSAADAAEHRWSTRRVARRINRASAARSAAGVDRRREAIGGGGSGGPKRRFQS